MTRLLTIVAVACQLTLAAFHIHETCLELLVERRGRARKRPLVLRARLLGSPERSLAPIQLCLTQDERHVPLGECGLRKQGSGQRGDSLD